MTASLKSTAKPTFPDSVITGLSKEFVDIFTPTTESPREFLWSAFVTAFGALMSPYVERGNGTQAQPRLYTCNIGPSGFGRKSTAAKRAVEVIRGAVDPTDLTFVDGFGSSEGILRAIISAPSNASTKVCVIYLDELEVLFRKAKVSGTAGVVPLQVLYESNSYSNVVQQNSVVITDAHLAMLANSTTDRFSDLWTADDVDSGFLSRWTLVYGEPTTRLPNPPLPDQVRLDALTEKLRGFIEKVQTEAQAATDGKIRVRFAGTHAERLWAKFYMEEIKTDEAVFNRIDGIGERLMVILTLLQDDRVIRAKTVRAVIEFLRYQVDIRRRWFPGIANNPVAALQQKIMKALTAVSGPQTYRHLYRKVHAEREGTEFFGRALNGLEEAGEIGRPVDSKTYWLRGEEQRKAS